MRRVLQLGRGHLTRAKEMRGEERPQSRRRHPIRVRVRSDEREKAQQRPKEEIRFAGQQEEEQLKGGTLNVWGWFCKYVRLKLTACMCAKVRRSYYFEIRYGNVEQNSFDW